MVKLRNIKNAGLSIIQNLSSPVAEIGIRLQMFDPVWGIIIGMGAGLLSVWRELAEDRGVELLEYVELHKNEFVETIVKSSEFKATFLNVWEMHIRENSKSKRQRLKRFLLNLGKGESINNDLHTKIFTVISQMTDDEAIVFGYIIKNTNLEMKNHMNLHIDNIPELKDPTEGKLNDALLSLHSYRLITIRDTAVIGDIPTIRRITDFGDMFFKNICSDNELN